MFDEKWTYRIIVMLALCILLVWTYLTNEELLHNYIDGKLVLDTRLFWQIGLFALLSIVMLYLLQSTLDYKKQNEELKEYLQRVQHELEGERDAFTDLKSESSEELMHLGSFIITISDMARQISSVLETVQLLKLLLRKTVDLLGSKKCAIFRVDSRDGTLEYVDSVGYIGEELEQLSLRADEESGQLGLAAKTGAFVSKELTAEDPTRRHILVYDKIETSYCQPIVHNDRALAVICVGDICKKFTHQQVVRLLSTLANFGEVALANTRLVDRIREQSIRDSHTWLYNYQFFQNRMDILLNQAIKKKEALGFIILDLDHFKQFNDTYGHQAGDFMLKEAAGILRSESESEDVVARYGGEEFVVILPGRDEGSSHRIAERIRRKFEERIFRFEGRDLKVTISAGLSVFNPSKEERIDKNLLIRYADRALYRAKEEGRNRVIIYGG